MIAAEAAFGLLGFERAKLADIASEAGIRRPSLLYHFGTKDALYIAVVQRIVSDLRNELLQSISFEGDIEDRVIGLMGTFVAFAESRPAFAPVVLRGIINGRGPMRQILGQELVPLLNVVESWLADDTATSRLPGVDSRSAILHLCSNALLRAASGPLRGPVWGQDISSSRDLAQVLFLGQVTSPPASG